MGESEVWDSLPTFEMRPQKTFFGLDKSGGHCFTLQKDLTDPMIRFFGLQEGKLQQEISLVIGDRDHPAAVRWVRIDRSRPNKLHPLALPVRDVVQFGWKSFDVTKEAIGIEFQEAFEQISSGKKNTSQSALFVHIRDNVFSLDAQSL